MSVSNQNPIECFLCWKVLDYDYGNENNNTMCSEKHLHNYSKYITSELLEKSVDRNTGNPSSARRYSLCPNCYDSSEKLAVVNDVLESVQKELVEIVETLNNYITELRNDRENSRYSAAKEVDVVQIDSVISVEDVKCNSDYEENFSPESNQLGLELESNETADSTALSDTFISQQTLSTHLPGVEKTAAVVNPFDLDCRIILERIDCLPYGRENALQPTNIQFSSGNNASHQSFENDNDEDSPYSPDPKLCIADSASNGLLSQEDSNDNDVDIKDVIVEVYCNDEVDEYSQSHASNSNVANISAGQELTSQGTTQATQALGIKSAYTNEFGKEIRIILSRVDVNGKPKGEKRSLRPRRSNAISKPNSEPKECIATVNHEKVQNDSDSDFVVDEVADVQCSYETRVKRKKRNQIKNIALRRKKGFIYPCRECPEKFNFKHKLKLHMVRVHPEKADVSYSYRFKCKNCGQRFKSAIGCKKHQERMHKGEDDKESEIAEEDYRHEGHACSLCKRIYCSAKSLQYHKKQTHDKIPLQLHPCKVCNAKFRRKDILSRHIATVHSEEFNFPCDECSEKFKILAHLRRHQRNHYAERILVENDKGTDFQCSVCNQSFKKEDSEYFVDHMLFHENENPFLCQICDKRFATKVYLEEHNKEKHYDGFSCNICGNKLSSFSSLQLHLKTVHAENKMMCDKCGAIFKCGDHLRQHYLTHAERNLPCKICGKKFISKKYIRIHIRDVHNKKSTVTCEYCGMSCRNNDSYKKHVRSHTGEKPFECNLCQEKFDQKVKLDVHKSKIHNIGKLICKTCGKEFNRKPNLVIHMRVHTGEKPYACNLCDKRFDRIHNFTTHMRFHTGEKPYKCPNAICGKSFSRKDNLNVHVRKCQNK